MARLHHNVTRGEPVSITVDGASLEAFEGESVVAALAAAGRLQTRTDQHGRPRAPYCNMGVCFECLVDVRRPGDQAPVAVLACQTLVEAGLNVTTIECREQGT